MAAIPTNFARGQVPASAATIYTVPAGFTAVIRHIRIANQSGTPTVTLNVVPSGGSAAAANAIHNAVVTVANTVVDYANLAIVLTSGDFIVWASSAATVNAYISGYITDGSAPAELHCNV